MDCMDSFMCTDNHIIYVPFHPFVGYDEQKEVLEYGSTFDQISSQISISNGRRENMIISRTGKTFITMAATAQYLVSYSMYRFSLFR